MITMVKAYKHANSSKVEVLAINASSVQRGYFKGGFDNASEENNFCRDMFVRVYEGKTRYYYQTYYIEESLTGMPARKWYAYSSTKDCNPSVVAKEILDCRGDLTTYEY